MSSRPGPLHLRGAPLVLAAALVAACGTDDGSTTPDAAPDDAGSDSAGDVAPADTSDDAGADATPDAAADSGADASDVAPDAAEDAVSDVWDGPMANIRVVHLVQSAPGIDLWLDGDVNVADGAFQGIRYLETGPPLGDANTYFELPARPTDALLVETGGPAEGAFHTDRWNLSPDAHYTVFVHGIWETEDLKFTPTVGVVVDDPSAPAEETTRMRFVVAAPALNDVTIRVGETVLAEQIGYGTYTPDYVNAEVGTYELIVLEGTEELFRPRITVGQETMNVFLVGETLDDLALITVNQGNALTMYER